jgi:hypothetical protein
MATLRTETMPAGKYWVGDLCYVLGNAWDEVCTLLNNEDMDYNIQLADGRRLVVVYTEHGDGEYFDYHGRGYMVDSGTIGAILVSDIKDSPNLSGGHVIDLPAFLPYFNIGDIVIGNVAVDTGGANDWGIDLVQQEEYF